MGISPDEDLTSYVHVAHGLEVSSQTNTSIIFHFFHSLRHDISVTRGVASCSSEGGKKCKPMVMSGDHVLRGYIRSKR
jgi:hypothetical protein